MQRIICLVIGYAFGLFQTGFIIGKIYKTDLRQHGSGNAGTTNALRTLGRGAGAMTLLGDMLKCILAVLLTRWIFHANCGDIIPLISIYTAFGVILGHNFPFYMGFKGGKGIAATAGFGIVFDIRIFLIGLVVFVLVFFTTHMVSLGSLSIYLVGLISMIIFGQMGWLGMNQNQLIELYIIMAVMTILAFYKHRGNIQRILSGTERKVYLSKKNLHKN